ncbi:MAG: glycosyltransferase [Actinobacteria bacterium]|nr:MAG: glycosyltransferase [Actinomycetota bacterium]
MVPGAGDSPPSGARAAPAASILVLSVDEAQRLERSLPAAARQGAELVVVDDACTDDTAAVAEAHGASVVRLEPRVSYCAAVNAGLRACAGEAVLLLNADCVLEEGFLAAALAELADPDVGAVAPRLLRATGLRPGERLSEIDAAGMTVDRRRKNSLVGHGAPAAAYPRAAEAFGGDGAAVLYRRRALEQCALDGEVLDEDFELWAADADLAWRLRTLGWRCRYQPAAIARHVRFYSPSTRGGLPARHRRLQFRNRYLMIAKNDSPAALARDLPIVLVYELLAFGHVLLRERHLLGGYRDALALMGRALRRRRRLAGRRRGLGVRPRVPLGLRPPR